MGLEKDIRKLVSKSKDAHGRIKPSVMSELLSELLESRQFPSEEILAVLVSRQEVLIEEDRALTSSLKREGEMRNRLLASIQSLTCMQNKRIEELNMLLQRLLVVTKTHVTEVEAAARSVDTERLGRNLFEQVYKVVLQKLEDAPKGIEIATNRLIKQFENSESALKAKSVRRWSIWKAVLAIGWTIIVLTLSGMFISNTDQSDDLNLELVKELSARNARLVERDGLRLIVVDSTAQAMVNEKGRGILVFE